MQHAHIRKKAKAWVIAVSMGYGHQRTAYPLRDIAPGGNVLNANDYEGIPAKDSKIWRDTAGIYTFISRSKHIPIVGAGLFALYNRLQRILSLYPKRDLSGPTLSLKEIYSSIRKGWGRDMVDRVTREQKGRRQSGKVIPFVTTFFMTAFMAEAWNYPGEILCVTADADVARDWAPLNPSSSRIHYCASTARVAERLALYGVPQSHIHLTGYPLPKKNIGGPSMATLKKDMRLRLASLDTSGSYLARYHPVVSKNFGRVPRSSGRPLTIMFSIGGAGAQKEIALHIAKSLHERIRSGDVRMIIAAGAGRKNADYFVRELQKLGFHEPFEYGPRHADGAHPARTSTTHGGRMEILWAIGLWDYFALFNEALRETDILWTKPSELSFYCGLGIPIIMAPPIGAQEDLNRKWLLTVGAGMDQYDPRYTHEWLFDYLKEGWFAEAAMHGFLDAETMGTYHIERLLASAT